MPHLHIGIVTPGFQTAAGDPFVPYWGTLVAALARRHRVTVLALRRPSGRDAYELHGARIVALPLGDVRLRRTPALWLAAWRTLAEEHARAPFDVLHALHANEAGFVATLAAWRARRPLVVHVGGGELVSLPDIGYGSRGVPHERAQVALALRAATRVTVGAHTAAEQVIRHLGPAGAERVRLAPFGVDTERFRPTAFPKTPRLLHVADLRSVKDQHTLLRAFAGLQSRRPAARLEIVGGGPELATLRRAAHALGIARAVRWWGRIPHAAMPLVYARASAFALSSRHEAQAVVLAEAAACGLPIASTAVGMAPDLPSDATWLAPPRQPAALAAAMHAALADGPPRARARAAGRASAEQRYAWPACAARLGAVYREAVDETRAAGHGRP